MWWRVGRSRFVKWVREGEYYVAGLDLGGERILGMRVTGLDSQYLKHDSSRDATCEYTVKCSLVVAEAMVLVVLRHRFVLLPPRHRLALSGPVSPAPAARNSLHIPIGPAQRTRWRVDSGQWPCGPAVVPRNPKFKVLKHRSCYIHRTTRCWGEASCNSFQHTIIDDLAYVEQAIPQITLMLLRYSGYHNRHGQWPTKERGCGSFGSYF